MNLVGLDDYRKWSLQPAEKIVHDPAYQHPTGPFQTSTSYTADYLAHKQAVRSSMRPIERERDQVPFDGMTGYRQDYVKHMLPRRDPKEPAKWVQNMVPLDSLSNYRKDYTLKNGEKTASCKPDGGPYQSDAPFEDGTTQRTDYKRWRVDRPHLREPDAYVKPDGAVDYHTTSHTDYNRKPIAPAKAKRPSSRRGVPGKFYSNTNYKRDFCKWPVKPAKQQVRDEYHPPDAPFEGRSNYIDNYTRHVQAVRESMRPTAATQMSDQPFDNRTGYREEYVKHPMGERIKREVPKWQPNAAKLDGMTNYKRDYVRKEMVKQPSCRPDNGPHQSDAPFVGGTTQRNDYIKWPNHKPPIHEPDQYVKPAGDMQFNTTTNTDFTKKPIHLVTAIRPTGRMGKPGNFDGTTNYSQDFRQWSLEDRSKPMMRVEYMPPEAPFQGSTNYHDDYHAHKHQPSKSMKPTDAGCVSDAAFEGGTEYRQEFIKKAVPPCPAVVLDTERAQHVYQEQDHTGHKWYKPLTASAAETQGRKNIATAPMTRSVTLSAM